MAPEIVATLSQSVPLGNESNIAGAIASVTLHTCCWYVFAIFDERQRLFVKLRIRAELDDSSPAERSTLVLPSDVGTPEMNEKLPDGEVSTHAKGIQCSTLGVNRH
jgi:hypothetical protein